MNWRTPSLNALGTIVTCLLSVACGAVGGGGGVGVQMVGGAVGAVCNPQYHGEGCHYDLATKVYQQVTCAADQKWALKSPCPGTQLCKETNDPAAAGKKIAECYDAPVYTAADTTGSGDTTTAGGDTTTTGGDVAKPTVSAQLACWKTKCSTEYNLCKGDSMCGGVLTCVEKCSDDNCAKACAASASSNDKLVGVAMCGYSAGCSGETPPKCGDGKCDATESNSSCPADCKTTTGPVCGNNMCESGETTASCAKDCPSTTTPKCGDLKCQSPENIEMCPTDCDPANTAIISCLQSSCGPQLYACTANMDCVKFLGCAAACKGNSSCQSSCMTTTPPSAQGLVGAVGQCASSNNCLGTTTTKCGNGTCDSGETTSCPKDCPTSKCGNGVCDSGETTSCPKDCPTSTGKCGDMQCTGSESDTCPMDCNTDYAMSFSCIAEVCGSAWSKCASDTKCVGFFNCSVNCNCNQGCIQSCSDTYNGPTLPGLIALSQCSGAASCENPCGSSTPVCGNGTCESGETASGCPQDCGSKPACGNGKCETGEASTCPSDCPTAGKAGCVKSATGGKGCGGCACENAVCKTGCSGVPADDYCCATAWDDQCASECAKCSPSYCPAP